MYIIEHIYVYISSMNPSEEAVLYRIRVSVDYTECDEATEQLRSMPELIGAVRTPTNDTEGAEGMAPREGNGWELRVRGGSCQGPSHFLPISVHGPVFTYM